MSDDSVAALLPAMQIAGFKRRPDGSFTSLAPSPAWFRPLIADVTFPFLGHILEEAAGFWTEGAEGRRDWGPCEEVDEAGVPFHYKVTAVTATTGQYLLFQLDPASDEIREMLQRVRAKALRAADQASAETETLAAVQREVQRASTEINELAQRVLGASSQELRTQLAKELAGKCSRLSQGVDVLVSSVRPPEMGTLTFSQDHEKR